MVPEGFRIFWDLSGRNFTGVKFGRSQISHNYYMHNPRSRIAEETEVMMYPGRMCDHDDTKYVHYDFTMVAVIVVIIVTIAAGPGCLTASQRSPRRVRYRREYCCRTLPLLPFPSRSPYRVRWRVTGNHLVPPLHATCRARWRGSYYHHPDSSLRGRSARL